MTPQQETRVRDREETLCNEVLLRGKVTAVPEERVLPSGAVIVVARLSVRREPTAMTTGSKQTVDVIDCAAWSQRVSRSARAWQPGDLVEVEGALRRRFFRAGAGTGSRVEVEVLRARVLQRARRAG